MYTLDTDRVLGLNKQTNQSTQYRYSPWHRPSSISLCFWTKFNFNLEYIQKSNIKLLREMAWVILFPAISTLPFPSNSTIFFYYLFFIFFLLMVYTIIYYEVSVFYHIHSGSTANVGNRSPEVTSFRREYQITIRHALPHIIFWKMFHEFCFFHSCRNVSAIELTGILLKKMWFQSRSFIFAWGRIMKVWDKSKTFHMVYVFPIFRTSDNIYDLDYTILHSSWKISTCYI